MCSCRKILIELTFSWLEGLLLSKSWVTNLTKSTWYLWYLMLYEGIFTSYGLLDQHFSNQTPQTPTLLHISSGVKPPAAPWCILYHHHGVCSPSKSSKDVLDVGIVSSRLGDGDTQLSVAQRPDSGDDPRDYPDDQGHPHGAGVFQNPLWTDEDARADDVTWWEENREVRILIRGKTQGNRLLLKRSECFSQTWENYWFDGTGCFNLEILKAPSLRTSSR